MLRLWHHKILEPITGTATSPILFCLSVGILLDVNSETASVSIAAVTKSSKLHDLKHQTCFFTVPDLEAQYHGVRKTAVWMRLQDRNFLLLLAFGGHQHSLIFGFLTPISAPVFLLSFILTVSNSPSLSSFCFLCDRISLHSVH